MQGSWGKLVTVLHTYVFGLDNVKMYKYAIFYWNIPWHGVAPITQVTHVRNKNGNIKGWSLNVIK